MNLILVYLMDTDYEEINYKAIQTQLENFETIHCADPDAFYAVINNIGQLDQDSIVTIFAHGADQGIAKGTFTTLITWADLLTSVSILKGNGRLTLNLLSTCQSSRILNYVGNQGVAIDEIWYTTQSVISMRYGINAIVDGFARFINTITPEMRNLFERWIQRCDE